MLNLLHFHFQSMCLKEILQKINMDGGVQLILLSYLFYLITHMIKSPTFAKKKLVQNFEFDPNDVRKVEGYQIIDAKNILLNEVFTLKRLSLNDSHNQHKHQSMLRQISILKDLSGINVVKCHKILKSKSHLYLVYDYFSGRNLSHLIQRNHQILQTNKKIDKLLAMKLQQDYIDFFAIQMIGRQLLQVLKEIQAHQIVHMRFWPQHIILGKNNLIKVGNFAHYQSLKDQSQGQINEQVDQNHYVDPFYLETKTYGFYTDIYSFGKILQQLYQIYQHSETFKPNKDFQQLITKMVQNNSYKRPDLEEIYEFFFENKKSSISKITKTRQQTIQNSNRMSSNMRKQTPSISSTTSQKEVTPSTSKVRKSHNEIRNRPERFQMRSVEMPQTINRPRESNSVSRAYSQTQKAKRQGKSPTQTQNSRVNTALDISIDHTQNFNVLISSVLKKRNISILLLKLGEVVASKIVGLSVYALQLTFLLYKRSLIEIVNLAKYLSKGSKKYIPEVTETMRIKFTKTQEYFSLTKVVNEQLQEQRNILVSISSLIKKECPSVMCFSSQGPSLVSIVPEMKPRETLIPELPEFEKEIKYQAFNNGFFMKTIGRYLDVFVSDLLVMNKTTEKANESLFFANILWEIYRCESFESFVQEFFSISWDSEQTIQESGKIPSYLGLLKMNQRLLNLKRMSVEELAGQLVKNLKGLHF